MLIIVTLLMLPYLHTVKGQIGWCVWSGSSADGILSTEWKSFPCDCLFVARPALSQFQTPHSHFLPREANFPHMFLTFIPSNSPHMFVKTCMLCALSGPICSHAFSPMSPALPGGLSPSLTLFIQSEQLGPSQPKQRGVRGRGMGGELILQTSGLTKRWNCLFLFPLVCPLVFWRSPLSVQKCVRLGRVKIRSAGSLDGHDSFCSVLFPVFVLVLFTCLVCVLLYNFSDAVNAVSALKHSLSLILNIGGKMKGLL